MAAAVLLHMSANACGSAGAPSGAPRNSEYERYRLRRCAPGRGGRRTRPGRWRWPARAGRARRVAALGDVLHEREVGSLASRASRPPTDRAPGRSRQARAPQPLQGARLPTTEPITTNGVPPLNTRSRRRARARRATTPPRRGGVGRPMTAAPPGVRHVHVSASAKVTNGAAIGGRPLHALKTRRDVAGRHHFFPALPCRSPRRRHQVVPWVWSPWWGC